MRHRPVSGHLAPLLALGLVLATAGTARAQAAPQSDDFNAPTLASFWTFVNPLGDGSFSLTGVGTGDAKLQLTVPAGVAHEDAQTVRVVQPVANQDFEIEAKFDSDVAQRRQDQGIVVQQDAGTFVSFRFYGKSSSVTRINAQTTSGGTTTVHINADITPGVPLYMRVRREVDLWTLWYSYDGLSWTPAGSFTSALAVSQVGVFAGNGGANPAHTAVVDYFFNTAAPLVPEDGPRCTDPGPFTLTLATVGNGSVAASPSQASYACGDVVTVTATPDMGWLFSGWLGDLSGGTNPGTVVMNGDRSVTATFLQDTQAPTISNINALPGSSSAIVSWSTDEPATSRVDFGIVSVGESFKADSALVSGHSLTLSPLEPDTTYQYQVTSVDQAGNPAVSTVGTFTTAPQGTGGVLPQSDDFNAPTLASFWSFLNPKGDGSFALTGVGSGDAKLALSVPAGVAHEDNQTVRVVQSVADVDFELEVKFDSDLVLRRQDQGLIIEQDATSYLRFYFYGKSSSVTRVAASSTLGGSSTLQIQQDIPPNVPLYMKVRREGTLWTQWYSYDGQSWTPSGSFVAPLTVHTVGVFAGNGGTNPAFTALVDYFFNTAAPLIPEDGPRCTDPGPFTLTLAVTGSGTLGAVPDQASYDCGDVVTLTATPDPGWLFSGWLGDLGGTTNPATVVMNGDRSVTATFLEDTQPPAISNVQVLPGTDTAIVTWNTDEPATSRVDFGLAGPNEGFVEDAALVTGHSVTLSPLIPDTTYQFQVTSVDASGNPASSVVDAFATAPEGTGGFLPQSDDFNGSTLAPFWSFVNPLGDGSFSLVGQGTGDAKLQLSVPGGTAHEENQTVRVVQSIADVDFQVEVKFDSDLVLRRQDQGLIFEQDAGTFIRVYFYGKTTAVTRISASTTTGGVDTQHFQLDIPPSVPLYERVRREGNLWTVWYSYDGQTWTAAGSFVSAINVASVGVFAGNGGTNPPLTAIVDYFFNSASPIVPEDPPGCAQPGPFTLTLNVAGSGTVSAQPNQPSYACGDSVTLTATPVSGWIFTGWSGDLGGSTNPVTLVIGSDRSITANFALDVPIGDGPTVDLWYGTYQPFGQNGHPQNPVNILGNVHDPDGVANLSYTLNGGPAIPLTIGLGGNPRLARVGDFNIDLQKSALQVGPNDVEIRAEDSLGNVSFQTVTVDYTDGVVPPVATTVDWSSASQISDVAQVVDGKWQLQGSGVRILQTGYDRLIAIGDLSWSNYEAVMEFTVHSVGDSKLAPLLGMATLWNGHFDWAGEQPDIGWYPGVFGGLGSFRWLPDGCNGLMVIGTDGTRKARNCTVPLIQNGTPYKMKLRGELQANGQYLYFIKLWPSAQAEPATWGLSALTGTGAPASGGLLLIAHHVDVTIGTVTVTPF